MKRPSSTQAGPTHKFESQEAFVEAFGETAERWEDDVSDNDTLPPAFALVLGAGGSQSAGIPLQGEMTAALERAHQSFIKRFPDLEFDPTPLEWWDELESHLFMACLARANREPNLTHLLAADMAAVGLLGPILTTNFDDLALAGFWALHGRTIHVEPHIVYDVKNTAPPRRIRRGVPRVLKAHGHHTTYSLARFQHQVRRLIPAVMKHYRRSAHPSKGFIVAGYSGAWNDGVLAILGQKDLLGGKVVYWLFRGEPPELKGRLRVVAETCDLRFVRIEDCDGAFMRMWECVQDRCVYLADKMLDPADLLTPIPMSVRRAYSRVATSDPQWRHGIEHVPMMTDDGYWALPALEALRAKLLPILQEIAALDNETLHDELDRVVRRGPLPRPNLTCEQSPGDDDYGLNELRLSELVDQLPSGLEWTRRNRVVLRMAIDRRMDYLHSIELLDIVQKLSAQARRIAY